MKSKQGNVWRKVASWLLNDDPDRAVNRFLCYAMTDAHLVTADQNRKLFRPRVHQVLEAAPPELVLKDGSGGAFLPGVEVDSKEGAYFRAGVAVALAAWADADATRAALVRAKARAKRRAADKAPGRVGL